MTTPDATRKWTAGTVLGLIRGGCGAAQLTAPTLIAGLLLPGHLDKPARRVARVLGARHLVQALGSGWRPTYPVLAVGVMVDALHAASMVLLAAVVDRGHRRAALTDALIASSFAIGGIYAARAADPARPTANESTNTLTTDAEK